jgi:hypothetical protein
MTKSNTESGVVQVAGCDRLIEAVLRIGDGRGFVVEMRHHLGWNDRIIITAAHCLPRLPPPYEHLLQLPTPHPARYLDEETYQCLLAPLDAELTVWATCLFVDPIADIAVLGQPDNQELSDQADAYDALVDALEPMTVADAPAQGVEIIEGGAITIGGVVYESGKIECPIAGEGIARVLSLEGQWIEGRVLRRGCRLEFLPHEAFVGGMSGSPIIDAQGRAIGVVSVDCMSPVILDSLSTWLVRQITAVEQP